MGHCELCRLQLVSDLQFAYHNVTAWHLKNLKLHLDQGGLGGYCVVCNEFLLNPKVANAHLQRLEHKQKVTRKINTIGLGNGKFVCDPCCLEFKELVGCEAHLATCAHKKGVTLSLSSLSVLLRQLSGSSLDVIGPIFKPLCSLCEEIFQSFDDFLMHLLTPIHIQFLLMSSCYVCEKNFPHLIELEKHLYTSKHQSNLQFYKKLLKRRNGNVIQLKQGYSCQSCLIWCKSWQCFLVHLMDVRHRFFSYNKNALEFNGESHPEFFPECNIEWVRWRDQPTNLSAWCYHCSEVLLSPEETEIHLTESCSAKSGDFQTVAGRVSTNLETVGILVCGPCSVGFKSSLSQLVHEAFLQHNVRTTIIRDSIALGWTLESPEKIDVNQKNASEVFDIIDVKRTTMENVELSREDFLEGCPPVIYETRRSLDTDASESSTFRACDNSKSHSDPHGLLNLSGSQPELQNKGITLQTKESHLQKDLSSDSSALDVVDWIKDQQLFSCQKSKKGCFSDPSVEKCCHFPLKSSISSIKAASSPMLASTSSLGNFVADSTLQGKDGNEKKGFEGGGHRVNNHLESSEYLNRNSSEGRHDVCTFEDSHNTHAVCSAENDHGQSHALEGESVVAAAGVLSPCQSLETSLKSFMNVLLTTLRASTAAISNRASVLPEVKRQNNSDSPEESNKRSKVDVLQEAVVQAMNSWCPTIVDNASTRHGSIENSRDGPSFAITRGQSDGLSMVVAAAVFSPSSDARESQDCRTGHDATNSVCSLQLPWAFQGENSKQVTNPSAQGQHVTCPVHSNKASPSTVVPHNVFDHPETNASLASNAEAKLFPSPSKNFDSEDESDSLGTLQAQYFSELEGA